jgi:hypothetical protein
MIALFDGLRFFRVLPPFASTPVGLHGSRPPEVRPSPPPIGWLTGFMDVPRLWGRRPFQRLRPALPRLIFMWSALLMVPMVARAQVALVEDVNSTTASVQSMDYVATGKQIRLGKQDTLVLSYLKSCWREAIIGGTVTVGAEQSDVQGGTIERQRVDCDGGRLVLTAQQGQSAGMVVRDIGARNSAAPEPQVTLFGASPLVEIKGGGVLFIERLDRPGERLQIEIGKQQLVTGAFYDFAHANKALVPGGIYRASTGTRQVVFKIDPAAKPGASPILGRLLRLQPVT